MYKILEEFESFFSVNIFINEVNGKDSYSWMFGPFYNKPVVKSCGYLLYGLLNAREEAFKIIELKKTTLQFAFKIIISNEQGVEKSFDIKPEVSRADSVDFLYYYYFTLNHIYRSIGIASPLKAPPWFIKKYSGLTSYNGTATNPTEAEKKLHRSEMENFGLQFEQKLVEQIKVASKIVRK